MRSYSSAEPKTEIKIPQRSRHPEDLEIIQEAAYVAKVKLDVGLEAPYVSLSTQQSRMLRLSAKDSRHMTLDDASQHHRK